MVIAIPRPDKTVSARRRLAKAMSAKLQLPVDDVLAHIIGSGTEACSEAAVSTWLNENGIDPSQVSLVDACDALERDLLDRMDV